MKRPLRVLIAEDNPRDAELIVCELRRADFEPEWERVDRETEYLDRLRPDLDLILSDYSMPQFGGMRALELLQESGLEVPFIIISGTIGEDTAVAVMKRGAADYLLKASMARLGQAVNNAMDQSRLRKESEQAQEAIRQSEHKYRRLFESLSEAAFLIECSSRRIVDANRCAEDLLGRARSEILGMDERSLFPSNDAETGHNLSSAATKSERDKLEGALVVTKEGRQVPVRMSVTPVALNGRDLVLALMTDVTERRMAEERILGQIDELRRWHDVMLGREDRVQELKREVNGLLVLLGKPLRYASQEAAESGQRLGSLPCPSERSDVP